MTRREYADHVRAWARDVSEHAEALHEGALRAGAVPLDALPDTSDMTPEQLLGAVEGVLGYELAPHVGLVIDLAETLSQIAADALTFAAAIESGQVEAGPWTD